MEEYLIAIKNHYLNVRGGKKIKVLTSGKKYKRVGYLLGYAIVINDIDLSGTAYPIISKRQLSYTPDINSYRIIE